nr:linear amide C-N hydrolase [Lachnospiraceae bacterium]
VQDNQNTERPDAGKESGSAADAGKEGRSAVDANLTTIAPAEKITVLEDGLSAVRYEGDYGFEEFLSGGGASSDNEVMEYLIKNLPGNPDWRFGGEIFGCSTIAVQSAGGEALFGRNFDWNSCDAMVVMSYPENAYASISTVNMNFIRQGAGGMAGPALNADEVRTLAALYAPLDGMNEKGLAVSVNMIQDSATIDQDTEKPDLTTTTAVRLLLDKAGTVEEAVELLGQYDMHASMGMMIHLAVADAAGNSVVVEYIGNEMVVTETPVVTNFYLAEGEKYGIGTEQSHERYEILMNDRQENEFMDETEVRDALDRVSKDNFGEFESTEWSVVFCLSKGKAIYYHRENYTQGYTFTIQQ